MAPRVKTEESAAATKLLRVLEEFRKVDPEMPLQRMLVLLGIVVEGTKTPRGEVTMAALGKRVDMAQSTFSRTISILAGKDQKVRYPAEFVRKVESPMDQREKLVELTPDGMQFMRKVISHLE